MLATLLVFAELVAARSGHVADGAMERGLLATGRVLATLLDLARYAKDVLGTLPAETAVPRWRGWSHLKARREGGMEHGRQG